MRLVILVFMAMAMSSVIVYTGFTFISLDIAWIANSRMEDRATAFLLAFFFSGLIMLIGSDYD
jgi:hypothetical protein